MFWRSGLKSRGWKTIAFKCASNANVCQTFCCPDQFARFYYDHLYMTRPFSLGASLLQGCAYARDVCASYHVDYATTRNDLALSSATNDSPNVLTAWKKRWFARLTRRTDSALEISRETHCSNQCVVNTRRLDNWRRREPMFLFA